MTRPRRPLSTSPKDLIHSAAKNSRLIEKKRQQIVEGACRVFFEKGYHPTTIRDIAQACGMSMGQLYHYISSKDDVLYLVHQYSQEVWQEHLKNSHIEEIKDPLRRMTEALHQTSKFMVEHRKLFQFIYTESKYLDKKHLRVVLEMDYKNVVGFWRQQLETLGKHRALKGNLDFLASMIAYVLVFLPLRGWTLRNRRSRKNVDAVVDFILGGLGVV